MRLGAAIRHPRARQYRRLVAVMDDSVVARLESSRDAHSFAKNANEWGTRTPPVLTRGPSSSCYTFSSPERCYVEADPVISSAGGSIIPRNGAIQAFVF